MTDPAIGYFPSEGYTAYEEGKELDIYLKNSTGDPYIGLVWAGTYCRLGIDCIALINLP